MKSKLYYPINNKTSEIKSPIKAQFRGGIYHIPKDSLTIDPLPGKEGFAVVATFDESGKPNGTEYIEDNRGLTVYDVDNLHPEEVEYLGPIKDGFTKLAPSSQFDKWDGEKWVTDVEAKYQHDYVLVSETREMLYSQMTDPLENEIARKNRQGKLAEVKILSERIDEIEFKIKSENPWPIKPQ